MNNLTIFAREAFYIRRSRLTADEVEQALEYNSFQFFKDSACEKCEFFQDRPTDTCEECPNNLGVLKLTKEVTRNGVRFLSLPIGDKIGLKKLFAHRDVKIVSKWKTRPMSRPIKFLGKLHKEQRPAVNDLLHKKRGVLKSPPRSGKTVMAACGVCNLGLKTLIIAAQRDWLVNFHETFVGSKTQKPMTDASHKRCGFAKTYEDFQRLDVALCTYQAFLSDKGKRLLERIKDQFSVLVVDEVHRGAATGHARVIASINAQYKWGLSGTPQRKDGKHKVMHRIVGPILHKVVTERLVPRVEFVPTGVAPAYAYKTWTYMIRFLELNPQRLKLIAKWAIKDAKNGHMVLIPMARTAAIRALVKAINRFAGDDIAAPFYGGVPKYERDKTIERARKYYIKIIVGNTKLLSTGINIPRASCIYQCSPSSNLPNAEQRFSRILTPFEDKPEPLIRVFADEMDVVKNCFRSEWWGALYKLFKPRMTEEVKDKLTQWMGSSSRSKKITNVVGGLGPGIL